MITKLSRNSGWIRYKISTSKIQGFIYARPEKLKILFLFSGHFQPRPKTARDVWKLTSSFPVYFQQMLDTSTPDDPYSENYVELLQMLKFRCPPMSQSEVQEMLFIINLRKEFHLEVRREHLVTDTDRRKLLHVGIKNLLLKIKDDREKFVPALLGGMKRLTQALMLDLLEGLYEVLKMVGNVHVSCAVLAKVAEIIDPGRETHENLHRLVALLLVHQMRYFEDSTANWELDPLAYPLADTLLRSCYDESTFAGIIKLELLRWVQLGSHYYDVDVLEEYSKRTTLSEKVFKTMFETANGTEAPARRSHKRDSLSAFEIVQTKNDAMEVTKHLDDQETIIKGIGQALQVVVGSLKTDSMEAPHRYFHELIAPIEVETVAMDFKSTLETLIKHKKYPAAVKLVELILTYQEATGVVIPADFAENLRRKSLKYFLSQKEPDYSSKLKFNNSV